VKTQGGGATRAVLSGFGEASPHYALGLLKDKAIRTQLVATRARWDTADSPHALEWLYLAGKTPEASRVVAERLAAQPNDVLALRMELDSLPKDARESVCARHRSLTAASPEDANLQYIADRCIEPRSERNAAFIAHSKAWPRNSWLAYAAGYAWARQGHWAEALPLLELAYRQEPALAATVAIDAARIRRLLAADGRVDLADLKARSGPLREYLMLDTGEGLQGGAARAYAAMSRGQLDQALEIAKQNPEVEARVLRLAAASDGANPKMLERALALPADRGLDQGTVWASIGLAVRERLSIDRYMDTLKQRDADDVEATLRFIDALRAGTAPETAESILDGLAPEMQGNVYSIAAVVLGPQTPASWRARAQRLLFANERPYFR
jgi:tetratricopeptide (TPR) repeat protein